MRTAPITQSNTRQKITPESGSEIILVGPSESLISQLSNRGHRCRSFSWTDPIPESPFDNVAGLVLIAPEQEHSEPLAYDAFRWLQRVGPVLRKSDNSILAAVTSGGGQFGLDSTGSISIASAALSGLVKTASHEWPEVACKVIDIGEHASGDQIADELFLRGPIEVGIPGEDRVGLELVSSPQSNNGRRLSISPGDLVIVTGGARGVTAATAIELARAYRPTMLLLGRTPLPTQEADWLATCVTDAAIKQAIFAHWPNGRATPREVEREFRNVIAAREVHLTMMQIRDAGATCEYHAVDVRDRAEITNTVADARRRFGPVHGIVHGSGVLADKRIEDKTIEQFATVYETKVAGLNALLDTTESDPLDFIALFSSSTARFGRMGQADYAAANEVLNVTARDLSRRRSNCRVVALNWGPWDGGMVTPALKQLFASENVGVIPVDVGARFFVAELSAADRPAEVVVLGPNPQLAQPATAELTLAFRRTIDLQRCPVLDSHVIAGKAVLPAALALEWLAHAAMLGQPGMSFSGCNQLKVLHPVSIPPGESIEISFYTGKPRKSGSQLVVPVELHAPRRDDLAACYHAEIVLGMPHSAPQLQPSPQRTSYPIEAEDAYVQRLFHGPELRCLEAITGCDRTGIAVLTNRAPAPAAWLTEALRGQWLAEPLAIDAALQALILWTCQERGAPSLPCGWESYRQYRSYVGDTIAIECRVTKSTGSVIRSDVDFINVDGSLAAQLVGCEMVIDSKLQDAFQRNRVAGSVRP